MPVYIVQWRYASGLASFSEGDVVTLDDELADTINRDSPGVLKPQDAPVSRTFDAPPQDRQVKLAAKRGTR